MERLFLVGLSHHTAAVDVRERFALVDACQQAAWPFARCHEKAVLKESLIVSTCNRVEIVGVGSREAPQYILETWAAACGQNSTELSQHSYVLEEEDAVRHLLSVASSLDSMIIGEPQILGQIKEAYRLAVEAGTVGTFINRLLHKAFSAAKRVRTETAIAANAVSISYAAVELAKRIFDDMPACRALLIGAGEMAELAATHLVQAGVCHMSVVNRTFARADELARQVGGNAASFDNLSDELARADIIISSTGASEPVITEPMVRAVLEKRRQRPMFFIDIAVPRDIAPEVDRLDNVYVYDIDNLKETVEENLSQRKEEALKAARIIDEECAAFMRWNESLAVQPTIVDLIRQHETYAEEELARALKRLGKQDDTATVEAIRAMLMALVRKIDHAPISYLKNTHHEGGVQQTEAVALTRRLFGLDK